MVSPISPKQGQSNEIQPGNNLSKEEIAKILRIGFIMNRAKELNYLFSKVLIILISREE